MSNNPDSNRVEKHCDGYTCRVYISEVNAFTSLYIVISKIFIIKFSLRHFVSYISLGDILSHRVVS
jgi:hypothetical protein